MQNFLNFPMSSVWTTSKLYLIFFNVLCPALKMSLKFSLFSLGKGSKEFWSIIFGMASGFNWELWIMKRTVLCLIFLWTLEKFIQAAARNYDNESSEDILIFVYPFMPNQKYSSKGTCKSICLIFSLFFPLNIIYFLQYSMVYVLPCFCQSFHHTFKI